MERAGLIWTPRDLALKFHSGNFMKITIAEGTPRELAEAFPQLFDGMELIESGPTTLLLNDERWPPRARPAAAACYVSKPVAQEMIRRRPLTAEQCILLREIYAAHPRSVPASKLQAKLGCSKSKFAGLMGSFGRRLAHTPSFMRDSKFFIQDWDFAEGCVSYGMPDSVREALGKETWIETERSTPNYSHHL
jgi:hypothetical protein